jgi:hypothetical protein
MISTKVKNGELNNNGGSLGEAAAMEESASRVN